jgi:hypothetical protein
MGGTHCSNIETQLISPCQHESSENIQVLHYWQFYAAFHEVSCKRMPQLSLSESATRTLPGWVAKPNGTERTQRSLRRVDQGSGAPRSTTKAFYSAVRKLSARNISITRGSSASSCTPYHSTAVTFLLDPYYVTHPATNDAAIQPHRSEYLRSLPTLKGFNRDFPPASKFTPCQQRVFLDFEIFIHCFIPVGTWKQEAIANGITKIYDVIS